MCLYSRRSCLHDHTFSQVITCNAIRYSNNTVRSDCLGPSGCYLSMKQTGIDTGQCNFDLSIAEYCSRRDCFGECWLRFVLKFINGCLNFGLKIRREYFNALSSTADDLFCQIMCGQGFVHTGRVSINQHRQIQSGNHCPGILVSVNQIVGLIERCAAPQIHQDQYLFGIIKTGNRILHLLAQIIRSVAGL